MKWEGEEQSSNVEDRRGQGAGGGGRRLGGRGVGIGTIAIALVAGWIFGINPLTVLGLLDSGGGAGAPQSQQAPAGAPPAGDRAAAFVSTVLRDTELVWGRLIQAGAQHGPVRGRRHVDLSERPDRPLRQRFDGPDASGSEPGATVQVEGERFERRALTLGPRSLGWVGVKEGLAAGEQVVTRGGYELKLTAASGAIPQHGHVH